MGVGSIRWNNAALQAVLSGSNGPVATSLRQTGRQIEKEAKQRAPVQTGRLRNSIRSTLEGTNQYRLRLKVDSDVPYAPYVMLGTRPHPIVGRPLLVFYWPKVGRTVAFRRVNHPGTKPNPFLREAIEAVVRRRYG